MRKAKFCLLILAAISLNACNPNNQNKSTFRTHSQITESFTSGAWYISSFVKDGTELGPKFSVYNLKFQPSNQLIAQDLTNSFNGSWSVSGIEGTDDNLPVDKHFIISMRSSPFFSGINGSWAIQERTKWKLDLIRADSHHKSNDHLVFEKR
jgi:hypothetical protein